MDSSQEADLTFYGKDGRECEQFIRSVQKLAFRAGKQDDSKWMANYAATCLDESALRWFLRLDEDTKNDWRLLSLALAEEYPATPFVPNSR